VLGLAWEFLALVRVRLWAKLLSIAALTIGGTGISPVLHFVASSSSPDFFSYEPAVEALIYNMRLLGLFDSSVATGAWQAVFGETPRAVRLPIETFGYQYAIGVRFLTDHDVRYVVWSIRESNNIDAKKSIMQAVDADYRWMEFSTTPEAHVGVWVRR